MIVWFSSLFVLYRTYCRHVFSYSNFPSRTSA